MRSLAAILRNAIVRPRTLFLADSPINGRVVVRERGRERSLLINDEVHSLYYKRGDWRPASREYWGELVRPPFPIPPNPAVFMIGLGGATSLRFLTDELRPGSIVVVEVDPMIISVARDFFGLDAIPRLEVIAGEGLAAARSLRASGRSFDLLIDDAFFNATSLGGMNGDDLFSALEAIARPGAVIVLNRPVDRPGDAAVNARLAEDLRRSGAEVLLRSVRGSWDNDVISYRRAQW